MSDSVYIYGEAINKLILAKDLETEARLLRQAATEVLVPLMKKSDITNYTAPDGGKITYYKESVSRRLDSNKLKEEFLRIGFPVEIISECFDKVGKESVRKAYVKYTPKE